MGLLDDVIETKLPLIISLAHFNIPYTANISSSIHGFRGSQIILEILSLKVTAALLTASCIS